MYKFGEFESFEEINELAENLFNEGDTDSIKVMAAENGIPEEMIQLYINGEIPVLCDAMTAALGKLEVEAQELKPEEIMLDWLEYIRSQCMDNEQLALQVRKKEKSLKGCIAALLKWSFTHQQQISGDILKAANVHVKVTLGIPGMGQAKKIIRDYYLGGQK